MACMCGDSECASCGEAQGTRAPPFADPDGQALKHALSIAFPDVEANAVDVVCGTIMVVAEEMEESLQDVTCPDCLRSIADQRGGRMVRLEAELKLAQERIRVLTEAVAWAQHWGNCRAWPSAGQPNGDGAAMRLHTMMGRALRAHSGDCGARWDHDGACPPREPDAGRDDT